MLQNRTSFVRYRSAGAALALSALGLVAATGCTRQTPVAMAPPVMQQQAMAPPMNGGGGGAGMSNAGAGVYQWQDVPAGQRVPVTRAVFDQGGYQIYCQTGETVVVPFANQSMYVMKFGLSDDGSTYFINDGTAPTLYVPRGGYLENTAAANTRWYPFAQNFAYTQPVYIGIAPTWNDYLGMGWYPGMSYYGGYWGYHPYGYGFSPMAGLMINIGGHPYYGWNSYRSYYYSNPYNRVYVHSAPTYSYHSVGRQASTTFGSSRTTTGSFGRSSGTTGSFGRSSGTTGSFGRSSGSTGSFGRSSGSTGSFGSSSRSTTGSFGSGSSGFGSSSRRSSGSFGTGSSGFGSSGRSSGSFGSGRSSGSFGSFGGSRSSSFGGGGRSSFGGGRRR